jgi:hypothetical protein
MDDVLAWQTTTQSGTMNIRQLNLTQGETYYISLSGTGFYRLMFLQLRLQSFSFFSNRLMLIVATLKYYNIKTM